MKTEAHREAEYNAAWEAWEKSAPAEAAEAKALTGGPKFDRLVPAKRRDPDEIEHDAEDPGPQPEEPSSSELASVLMEVIYLFQGSKDRTIRVRAEALAVVIGRSEKSEQAIADENGIGRAAVSKIVRELKSNLGIKTARATRSDAVVAQARARALRVHAARRRSLTPKKK